MTGNELFDLRSRSLEQRLALTSRLAGADTQMANPIGVSIPP